MLRLSIPTATSARRRALAALALLACALAHGRDERRLVLLTGDGQPAGEQVSERGADGWLTVHFRFKDNGRGPEFTERIRLGGDGLPTDYLVEGNATMGGPIDERFERRGERAHWQSTSERGETTVASGAMYAPVTSSFEWAALAQAAMASRTDGRLALLPSGTLSQRVLDEVELVDGTDPARRLKLQLVAHTGLGLTPSFYWFTAGPSARLFAVIQPTWLSAIELGWEPRLPLLAQRQAAAEAALLKDLATRLRTPLPGLTVVRNARVFDSDQARLTGPSDIYLLRGRITQVLPAGTPVRAAAQQEIDAAGRVALPGLFDMHGHVGRWEGALHLAAGVTTVRDMGNDNRELQGMIDDTATGTLLMPQLVPCGFLEGKSPYSARLGIVIETLQQAKDAVDWYATHGYPQLKIYNSFPRGHLAETVRYAHARGMRVSGHVPAFLRAQDVVDAGFDEVQHINQLLLNFLVTPTTDTRTLERFYLPAEKLAAMDFDTPAVRRFVALLARRGVVIDPTLGTFEFIRHREGTMARTFAPIASHLPPDLQRQLMGGGLKIPDDATAARYNASYEKAVAFVGRLYKAGVPIVAGTDDFAGFALHNELALYVQAGLTPAQALQVATRNGARYTRTSADRGSIAPGKLADIVLVDGDPTRDIADLRRVAAVVTQGQLLSPSAMHEALGIQPFVDHPPVLRTLASADDTPHSTPPRGAAHAH